MTYIIPILIGALVGIALAYFWHFVILPGWRYVVYRHEYHEWVKYDNEFIKPYVSEIDRFQHGAARLYNLPLIQLHLTRSEGIQRYNRHVAGKHLVINGEHHIIIDVIKVRRMLREHGELCGQDNLLDAIKICLAHELIHVEQTVRGDLVDDEEAQATIWTPTGFVKKWNDDHSHDEYMEFPWEIEAYDRQESVMNAINIFMLGKDVFNNDLPKHQPVVHSAEDDSRQEEHRT